MHRIFHRIKEKITKDPQIDRVKNSFYEPTEKVESEKIRIITDEPLVEGNIGFDESSQLLAKVLQYSTPHFTIGIFGDWGTGKSTLMRMIKRNIDIALKEKVVTVWFDTWRYEKEENLAVIPFLRTVKLTLDTSERVKTGNWNIVKNGVVKTGNVFSAIARSTKLTSGVPGILSADIDFGKAADVLKGDGSIGNDRDTIHYHVTGFLEKSLLELRKIDPAYRIVIFIDDLDRCTPEKAMGGFRIYKELF